MIALGLKPGWSRTPGIDDIAYAMEALQTITETSIVISVTVDKSGRFPSVSGVSTATRMIPESGEVKQLACHRWRATSSQYNSLESAILQSIYVLDSMIGRDEHGEVSK